MPSKLAVLLAALLGTASAQAATLIPVPNPPGSFYTVVQSINDDNVISGNYEDSQGTHAFFGTLDGNYTIFDFDAVHHPGTEARGINNKGQIVGVAGDTNITTEVEFERAPGGTMTLITDQGTPVVGVVGGINAKGVFVAENRDQEGNFTGLIGKKAKVKSVIDLGFAATRVRPRGVASSGDVVGYTLVTGGTPYQGFILHDGSTTLINYPDETAAGTYLQGVNSKGIVSGYWEDENADEFAFFYDSKKAKFTPVDVPDYPLSFAGGVNSAGLIAVEGTNYDFSVAAPYIYCPRKPSKCPSGGFEIADAKPVAMVPGYKPHAVPNPAPMTLRKAKLLSQQ